MGTRTLFHLGEIMHPTTIQSKSGGADFKGLTPSRKLSHPPLAINFSRLVVEFISMN
jgi:hypothetical protein